MKSLFPWILSLVIGWSVPVCADREEEFRPLYECIEQLKTARAETGRRMPAFFLNLDFNLRLMEEGISHLEGNYDLLKKLDEDQRTANSAKHLVWNSAKACRDYLESYRNRTSMLFLLFVCACILILMLPVSLIAQFFIKRNRARRAVAVPEEQHSTPPPPRDKVEHQ